jgi:hypothetical protein
MSDDPLIDTMPPTDNTTTNSCIACAHVHHRVTPPRAPLSTHHQTPHLCQTTLPGAFQPRSSSAGVDGDISRKASGCNSISPTPGRIDTSSSTRVDGDISRKASGCDSVLPAPSCIDTTLPTSPSTPAANSVVLGGPIISPRNWDKETQARTLGASRFDAIRLACSSYHVSDDGVPTLTEDIIRKYGYTRINASANKVVVCYNDIKWVHKKVREL